MIYALIFSLNTMYFKFRYDIVIFNIRENQPRIIIFRYPFYGSI